MDQTRITPPPKPECDAGCIKAILDAMIEVEGAAKSLAGSAHIAGPSKVTPTMVSEISDLGRQFVAATRKHKAALGFPTPAPVPK